MHKAPFATRRSSKERRAPRVTAEIGRTFFALCKNINTPHSLALWLCFKHDHESFVELTLDPKNYGDARLAVLNRNATPTSFAYDLLAQEYLSKYKGLKLARDTKKEAISTFKSAEETVASVNRRLLELRSASTPRLEAIISIARRKISEVLGLRSEAQFSFGWGPGSTFSISGDVGWDRKILEKRISVTASALPLAQCVIGADIHWCRARGIPSDAACSLLPAEFDVVTCNRITTVPKNAKTDRTIAIEPTANIYLQKGIGSWIRGRLRKIARIDLNSQALNQRYAGRLDYATIDLKAASDSISEQIVRLLLPDEWVFLLDACRSSNYHLDGNTYRYQKWSSMGNGYTFELETLLFWALSMAAQLIEGDRPHAIVYGDDILVPVDSARNVIATLGDFGFQTNLKKTHYESLYRESCGAHFYNRCLVTPVYQKEVPSHVGEIYHMANRLRLVASRLGGYHFSDKTLFPAWKSTLDSVHRLTQYSPLSWSHASGSVEPVNDSLEGGFHLSLEDCELLGLPVFTWGSKVSLLCSIPRKRKYDQAAGVAFVLMTGASLEGADFLSFRGRNANRNRRKRCFRSFRSNVWL